MQNYNDNKLQTKLLLPLLSLVLLTVVVTLFLPEPSIKDSNRMSANQLRCSSTYCRCLSV